MPTGFHRAIFGAAAVTLLACSAAWGQADSWFRFGDYDAVVGDLQDPAQVAMDTDGAIYVAEAGRGRISVFGPDGAPRREIGRLGHADGELLRPMGVAVDADGTVYVSDTGNHRIQVFGPDGVFLRGWGAFGDTDGAFNEPRGITVRGGNVYVADLGNHRVQVFDASGTHRATVGGPGRADGLFNRPVDVDVDSSGAIFVADADNNRIQKFDADGSFLLAWGDWGPFVGLLDEPGGVVCHDEHVYVADTRNHRVQVFTADGELVERWGTHAQLPHEGDGKLHYPVDLAIAPGGTAGVICESFENRIQLFGANPEQIDTSKPIRTPIVRKMAHFGDRLDIDRKLLAVGEPESHRLYVFEMSRDIPIVIGDFGDRGTQFGQMIRVAGFEVDVDEQVLITTDVATRRVQRYRLDYDPDGKRAYSRRRGRFSRAYDLDALAIRDGIDVRWPIEPAAIERDASGNIYVVDPRNAMVHVFDADVVHIRSFGGYGDALGAFRQPTDLAFDRSGETIFVVDSGNQRVQAFDHDGTPLFAFGTAGEGPGEFLRPFGIAAGRDGFVYVTDDAAHRVQKFTEDGTFVGGWGQLGIEHEDFWKPRGVDQDDRGRVFVLDYGNHKAKIFTPDGVWLVTFGTGRAFTNDEALGKGAPGS